MDVEKYGFAYHSRAGNEDETSTTNHDKWSTEDDIEQITDSEVIKERPGLSDTTVILIAVIASSAISVILVLGTYVLNKIIACSDSHFAQLDKNSFCYLFAPQSFLLLGIFTQSCFELSLSS